MCRVCLKRPEIPDERHGRCEACARSGRIAVRFRVGLARTGVPLAVKAGELSPRALRSKWLQPLEAFRGRPSTRPHLGLHEIEMVVARDRLESIRVAPDLAPGDEAVVALREAARRTDAAW